MRAFSWLAAGGAQVALGLVLGMALASGSVVFSPSAHLVAMLVGLALALGGLALGLAAPFLRRVATWAPLAAATMLAALAGDVVLPFAPRLFLALEGISLLLLVAHLPVALARGARYEGDDLFGEEQPFRVGDRLAAGAFALGGVGLLAGGILLLVPPRDVPTSAIVLVLVLGLLPVALGALAFLLPRLARAPLSGSTILGAALVLAAAGGIDLAFAYARPLESDFRYPSTAVALALVLALLGLLRVRLPADLHLRFAPLRPVLKGAFVLAGLGAVVLFLAMLGGHPTQLTPVALYLLLGLASLLAVAVALAAGPLLFAAVPGGPGLARWAAALAIASMFLVAPAFQYPRSAFPGVAVAGLAILLAALLLAPMGRSARPRMRRR